MASLLVYAFDTNQVITSTQTCYTTEMFSDINKTKTNAFDEKQLRAKLIASLGKKVVDDWFGEFSVHADGCNICIYLPDIFMRDWINTHYIDQIYTCLKELTGLDCHICLDVMEKTSNKSSAVRAKTTTPERSLIIDNGRYTFDNFIVGKTNEMAQTAAMKVCDVIINNQSLPINPLFIYGEPGVGKSHLLAAIKHQIEQKRPDIKITHMTAEQFMYEFIKALKERDVVSFKEMLRSSKVLLIDDVPFIIGKDSTQEEFFHTFNYLRERHCQIVLSSDKPASKLDGLEDRLKSRLGWGLSIEIHQPNYELRLAILQHKIHTTGVHMDLQAMEFLASQLTGNLRDLEGTWNKLVSYSHWLKQDISVMMVRQILNEMNQNPKKLMNIEDIQKCIAEFFGMTVQMLKSTGRKQDIVRARHIGVYLSRELTDSSLAQIATAFGGRDHTAISYGVKKIKEDMMHDRQLLHDVEKIKAMIAGVGI